MSNTTVAKKRWKLLAKAIVDQTVGVEVLDEQCISTQLRGLFGVLECRESITRPHISDEQCNWRTYTCPSHPELSLHVRQVNLCLSPSRLTGYNNTGNIRLWPSEEILTFYCLENKEIFKEKNVIELGGGMTCLAAMACCDSRSVYLTDGNPLAVENVQILIEKNSFSAGKVEARILDWVDSRNKIDSTFDVILSADCLFFDEGRQSLVDFMFEQLSAKGIALIIAPRRGITLQDFIHRASKNFRVTVKDNYHGTVTALHRKYLKEKKDYNSDLHYPILVILEKDSES